MRVHCLIFNGFSDWELGYVLPELRKNSVDVVTVGLSPEPVLSAGGLKVLPDLALNTLRDEDVQALLLPGGTYWEQGVSTEVINRLRALHTRKTVLGGICSGTLPLAKAGLLNGIKHTSNDLGYLKAMAPDYRGDALYAQELSASAENIVTAAGVAPIEFARDLLVKLGVYDAPRAGRWFDLFKHAKWTGPI